MTSPQCSPVAVKQRWRVWIHVIIHIHKNWHLNTLMPRQNRGHFADNIFKCIFLDENVWIAIHISLRIVPKGSINNILALVQIMAWRRSGDKPLSEPMMVRLPTHICVTRPRWVNKSITKHDNVIHICCTTYGLKHCGIGQQCGIIMFVINIINMHNMNKSFKCPKSRAKNTVSISTPRTSFYTPIPLWRFLPANRYGPAFIAHWSCWFELLIILSLLFPLINAYFAKRYFTRHKVFVKCDIGWETHAPGKLVLLTINDSFIPPLSAIFSGRVKLPLTYSGNNKRKNSRKCYLELKVFVINSDLSNYGAR